MNCGRKLAKNQCRNSYKRKWNWLGHRLKRTDDRVAKQALQWTQEGPKKILNYTWSHCVLDL